MNDPGRIRKVKVKLMILGFTEQPDEMSRILGVSPSRTWTKGEPVAPGAHNRQPQNGWQLSAPVDPINAEANSAVESLLSLFPDRSAFRRLPSEAEVQLTCTVYAYGERPWLYFSRQTVSMLGEIGASLDVDIYDLSEGSGQTQGSGRHAGHGSRGNRG